MQLASQKWGKIKITGDEAYRQMCVKVAAEHNFQLANKDLAEQVVALKEQLKVQRAEEQLERNKREAEEAVAREKAEEARASAHEQPQSVRPAPDSEPQQRTQPVHEPQPQAQAQAQTHLQTAPTPEPTLAVGSFVKIEFSGVSSGFAYCGQVTELTEKSVTILGINDKPSTHNRSRVDITVLPAEEYQRIRADFKARQAVKSRNRYQHYSRSRNRNNRRSRI